ncbi:MAG: hypothetical protein LBV41_03705, partial [Cytophagaceae bacterium]|nr:hypothetical protein [Cytophagaceae bacterium]
FLRLQLSKGKGFLSLKRPGKARTSQSRDKKNLDECLASNDSVILFEDEFSLSNTATLSFQ